MSLNEHPDLPGPVLLLLALVTHCHFCSGPEGSLEELGDPFPHLSSPWGGRSLKGPNKDPAVPSSKEQNQAEDIPASLS